MHEALATDRFGNRFHFTTAILGGACITKCEAHADQVEIPADVMGYPVVELGESSFRGLLSIRSVVCPPRLRRIGARAFESCMHLERVELNDGLGSIGDAAFALCMSLSVLDVPASVDLLGVNLAGMQGSRWTLKRTHVRIDRDNPYLFMDAQGVLYKRSKRGNVLLDASHLTEKSYTPDPLTVEIGHQAFAQLEQLESVVLPEGVKVIGEAAFRGCTALSQIVIPETLEAIADAAFSCTAVTSLYLPKNCTHLGRRALVTGPVIPGSQVMAYRSNLREISVHPDNPRYCMRDSVLCKRMERTGELVAVLCPSNVEHVDLASGVAHVGDTAFAGTYSIGELRVDEGTDYCAACGLLPHCRCANLTVNLARPVDGMSSVSLEIPEGKVGASMLENSLSTGCVDAERLLETYDLGLLDVTDGLAQARQMIARLAAPVHLSSKARATFTEVIVNALESVCIHFGARNYWHGFDQMADAGILDEGTISRMVGVLSEFGDAPAVGYLLNLKNARFGKAALDYAL